MKVVKLCLFFLFFAFPALSQECFIVTDIRSNKILFNNNPQYSNKLLLPGSLLKPFAMLSAKNGDKTYRCKGWEDLDHRCWNREGHGNLNLTEALAYSCNSYFIYYLEGNLDISNFHETLSYYLNFEGFLTVNNYIEESIGLGVNIKITPIELLKGYNKLFTQEPEGIETIRQGMEESTYYGTAKTFSNEGEFIDGACKTGTSYRVVNGDIDWKSNTGWFLIIYPSYEPKYSALKVIDSSRSDLSVKKGTNEFKNWLKNN